MRVAGGVSTHGAAVNITTDLSAFQLIVPCGQPQARVTSLAQEMAPGVALPSLESLAGDIAARFAVRFGFALVAANHHQEPS
jgi:lipoyl(octanoyl) transferase